MSNTKKDYTVYASNTKKDYTVYANNENNIEFSGTDRLIAGLLSWLCPGLGQCFKGEIAKGAIWFGAAVVGYMFLILPGVIIHLAGIVDAASNKQ